MAVTVDLFRLRDVWDVHDDAEERLVEAPDIFEMMPAVQLVARRLHLVQGVEAADEAGAERVTVDNASRSVLRLPPGERFTIEVGTRNAARLIGLAARHIGVHLRAPRLDRARFARKQQRLIKLMVVF